MAPKKKDNQDRGLEWPPKGGGTTAGLQKTRERKIRPGDFPEDSQTFTPMETGQPDRDPAPGIDNPTGAQGGRGPTNQEGEGDLQNDQLEALEEVEPDLEIDKPDEE